MSLINNSNKTTTFEQSFNIKTKGKVFLSDLVEFGEGASKAQNPNYIFDKEIVQEVLYGIKSGDNVLLWGDAGSGKTELVSEMACRLNRPSKTISFGEESTLRKLIGGRVMRGDETPFEYGALLQAITTPYMLVCLDEINMAPPGVVAMLNHLLESKEIVIDETGEVVKCATGVTLFATSNTNLGVDETGMFEGSQSQNNATRTRFCGIEVRYLKPEDELKLVHAAFPDLDEVVDTGDKPFSELSVQLANVLRDAMRDGAMSLPFSVRQLKKFIDSSMEFGCPARGFRYAYWNMLDSVQRQSANDIFRFVFNKEVSPRK